MIGLDEVGRGPWAGPLVVAAVELRVSIDGLADSKKLSAIRRKKLSEEVYQHAAQTSLAWVSPAQIDAKGLGWALGHAFETAFSSLSKADCDIVIDGKYNYLPTTQRVITLAKADAIIPAVSAASIIAKVARDEYMQKQAKRFFRYGFDTNAGYGTKAHHEALLAYGMCNLHRRSFKPMSEM